MGEPVYAADVASVQCLHETSFMRYGGAASAWNPAGIKTASASGDRPQDFEKPANPAEGARMLINHMAAYIHGKPYGVPHGRYEVARRARLNQPAAKTVDDLAGSWAADPDYGRKLRKYLDELEGSSAGSNVDKALAYVEAMVGGPYIPWRSGRFTSRAPAWVSTGPLPKAYEVAKEGGFCACVPSLILRFLGLPIPTAGTDWAGGVLAYGDYYVDTAKIAEPFDPAKLGKYQPGDLFIRRYTGPRLADQGHIAALSSDGVHMIQSDAFGGWNSNGTGYPGINESRTIKETNDLLKKYDGGGFDSVVRREKWLR